MEDVLNDVIDEEDNDDSVSDFSSSDIPRLFGFSSYLLIDFYQNEEEFIKKIIWIHARLSVIQLYMFWLKNNPLLT